MAENAPPLQSIQMAVVVIAMIPILCVYPFLQRYFTRGVLSGAIKGRRRLSQTSAGVLPHWFGFCL